MNSPILYLSGTECDALRFLSPHVDVPVQKVTADDVHKSRGVWMAGRFAQNVSDAAYADDVLQARFNSKGRLILTMAPAYCSEEVRRTQYIVPSANVVFTDMNTLMIAYKTHPDAALEMLMQAFRQKVVERNDLGSPPVAFILNEIDLSGFLVTREQIERVEAEKNMQRPSRDIRDIAFAGFFQGLTQHVELACCARMGMIYWKLAAEQNTSAMDPERTRELAIHDSGAAWPQRPGIPHPARKAQMRVKQAELNVTPT